MLPLNLSKNADGGLTVLCLGAHCDDIEIGCGGTLLYLRSALPEVRFHWIVFSASGSRGQEAAKAAELFTAGCEKAVALKGFRDGFLPYSGSQVKDCFEEIKAQVKPDLIFTHWHGDAHQDHRLISELTSNTFRNHLILEFEIPKYDGDMGRPSVYVPLGPDVYQTKIRHIFDAFQSQHAKHWFQRDTFLALMRLRGMECRAPERYAEGLFLRKGRLG